MENNPFNPPAFPRPISKLSNLHGDTVVNSQEGMTLRDHFAALAMVGLYSRQNARLGQKFDKDAEIFYKVADALLAERLR
jgi:hypothetical protein